MSELDIKNPVPGIYEGVCDKDYFAIEACNNSHLSDLKETAAHSKVKKETTPSMFLGKAVHCYVLEGVDAFKDRYKITRKMSRNTKKWKSLAKETDKLLIQAHEFFQIYGVYKGIQNHPRAKKLLSGGMKEVVVIWVDQQTGLLCKAKIDYVSDPALGYIADLKTTKNANPKEFAKAVINLGYHRQDHHYRTGINAESPYLYNDFKFIACEVRPPFRVQIFSLDAEFMALGKMEIEELLQKEEECVANNEWAHYTTDPHTGDYEIELDCPMWAHTRG